MAFMKDTYPYVKEALLYQMLEDRKVRCNTCERHCEIPPDKFGACKTRENVNGKLYTLEYGNISSLSANPIEKKPLFHFYPGSYALTIGSWSCNFACPWCQNWEISKSPPNLEKGYYVSPEKLMELMGYYNCQGTSISFNEPTLLYEYSLDVLGLAKKEGYYNTYVTNGYMTSEALKSLINHGLDAMNIDIKGDRETVKRYCKADVEHIWRNAKEAKEQGVWVEITTLVISGVNDNEGCLKGISARISEELGRDTPWHVTGYYPAYEFKYKLYVPPTPISTLERARGIGIEEGLRYVYAGNAPGHRYENTWCPTCKELLIERYGFGVTRYRITPDKKCPKCKEPIPIVGEYKKVKG